MAFKGNLPSRVLITALMAVAFGQGCSIKEDRALCPCSFFLDFSGVDPELAEMSEIRIEAADGFLYYDPEVSFRPVRISRGVLKDSYTESVSRRPLFPFQ